jgi:hypothetical protein
MRPAQRNRVTRTHKARSSGRPPTRRTASPPRWRLRRRHPRRRPLSANAVTGPTSRTAAPSRENEQRWVGDSARERQCGCRLAAELDKTDCAS